MRTEDEQPLFGANEQLQALEDPRVTEAFAQLEAALTTPAANSRGRLKVSHLVVMAVALAAMPAALLWLLGM